MFDPKPTRTRRSYTKAFKRKAVAETREPGVSVAEVARRYGMNANVLFHWLRDRRFNAVSEPAVFLPVEAASAPVPATTYPAPPQSAVRTEPVDPPLEVTIELPGGPRLVCRDERSLVLALRALKAAR